MTLPKQPYLIQEEHYSSSHETRVPHKNRTYQFAIYNKLYINYNLNISTKLNWIGKGETGKTALTWAKINLIWTWKLLDYH